MKTKLILVFLFLYFLLISACAIPTQRGFEQMLSSWQYKNINDLISVWDFPTNTFEMPNGNKVYVYNRSNTYTTPIYRTPTYTSPSQTTINMFGNTAYATTIPGRTYGGQILGGQTLTNYCNVSFQVDSSQRIIGYRWEGNSCRAVEKY